MKSKNIILFSILLSCGIFSCNNPIPVNTNINPSSTVKPIQLPTAHISVSSTPTPIPSKLGVIKIFVENKTPEINYDSLFYSNDLQRSTFVVNSNKLYYSNGSIAYIYNLSDSKFELNEQSCYTDPDWSPLYNNVSTPKNAFCDYRGYNFKQGKNNSTYLFNSYNIAKVNNNSILKINSLNTFTFDIAIDKLSNTYITSTQPH